MAELWSSTRWIGAAIDWSLRVAATRMTGVGDRLKRSRGSRYGALPWRRWLRGPSSFPRPVSVAGRSKFGIAKPPVNRELPTSLRLGEPPFNLCVF